VSELSALIRELVTEHPRDTRDTIARLVADATPDRRETIDDLRHLRLRQPVDPI
jgi:hypothetical protein